MIGPGYPPHGGGVETHLGHLSAGLAALGVEVEVWVHDDTVPTVTTDTVGGVLVRRFPATRSRRFPFSVALHRHARRYLRSVDLVHAHSYHASAAAALLAAPTNIPVVFTPHFHGVGHSTLAKALHVPYQVIGTRMFARADSIVAVSAAERALIVRRYPDCAAKAVVIHNGADVAGIHAASAWPDEPPTLLVLGRLERYKRVDTIIDAFGRSTSPGQLVVVGAGPERDRLAQQAAGTNRANDVRFLGRVDDAELHRWLRTARAVVSLSEQEAFGLVALESVAGGGMAVLSDIPAHREVHGLLPAGSVRVVRPGASRDQLALELDQALIREMGPSVAVPSWTDAATRHLELFEALLARHQV